MDDALRLIKGKFLTIKEYFSSLIWFFRYLLNLTLNLPINIYLTPIDTVRARAILLSFVCVRRNFFLTICMFLVVNMVSAQKYSLGLRAGGTLNWASFRDKQQKDTFSVKPSTGFNVGALIGFPLKNNYSVIIEGGFSQKSRTIKDFTLLENHATYRFVDGSLLLRKAYKFNLGENVPADWFFNIGPEVGYWLSGKGYFTAGGPRYPYQIEFDKAPDGDMNYLYYNSANRVFFALVIGVGMKAPLRNNTSITTELRFVSGHTNLGSNKYDYPTREWYASLLNYEDTLRMNMKIISLSVAYTYDFDKVEARKGKSTLKKTLKKGK